MLLIQKYGIDKMEGFCEYKKLAKPKRVYNPQMKQLNAPRIIGGGVFNNDDFIGMDYITAKRYTDKAYPTAIIEFSNRKSKPLLHPTQKPVELLKYLIKTYTNEGETVLDNCMGSGSTGVACVNAGRNFIGMELDENYFEIAKERIEKAGVENAEP